MHSPFSPIQFAAEQLSHATYVYVGEGLLSGDTIIRALIEGRTCVTRGAADFQDLRPVPSRTAAPVGMVRIALDLPRTYSVHRPRNVLIYRDGNLADWIVVSDEQQAIKLDWTDRAPVMGRHNYVVYIPSKFLSSPIVLDVN